MVIKRSRERILLEDMEETFRTLEKVNRKLNSGKCTYSVEEGQLLGYYVIKQGIQHNPTNMDKLMEVPSPYTLRDAQGLNGKLAAPSHFISKSAEKAMPVFHTSRDASRRETSNRQ